jgi:hypothetical protein
MGARAHGRGERWRLRRSGPRDFRATRPSIADPWVRATVASSSPAALSASASSTRSRLQRGPPERVPLTRKSQAIPPASMAAGTTTASRTYVSCAEPACSDVDRPRQLCRERALGPRIPTGRGEGLKHPSVWVRIPPGAQPTGVVLHIRTADPRRGCADMYALTRASARRSGATFCTAGLSADRQFGATGARLLNVEPGAAVLLLLEPPAERLPVVASRSPECQLASSEVAA